MKKESEFKKEADKIVKEVLPEIEEIAIGNLINVKLEESKRMISTMKDFEEN